MFSSESLPTGNQAKNVLCACKQRASVFCTRIVPTESIARAEEARRRRRQLQRAGRRVWRASQRRRRRALGVDDEDERDDQTKIWHCFFCLRLTTGFSRFEVQRFFVALL